MLPLLDRIQNAITYRIYGCETQRNKDYESHLADYEKASVRADLPVAALPPVYKLISMTGVLLIFYFGSKNVIGNRLDFLGYRCLQCFPFLFFPAVRKIVPRSQAF